MLRWQASTVAAVIAIVWLDFSKICLPHHVKFAKFLPKRKTWGRTRQKARDDRFPPQSKQVLVEICQRTQQFRFFFFLMTCHKSTSWISGEEYVRPRSGRASDEVARGRLVSLEGFSFAFRAKNEEWRDRFDQNNRTCVRFSCVDRKSKFVYSVLKLLRRKSLSENWPKLVWILNCSPERRSPVAKVHFWQTFCAVRRPPSAVRRPPSASAVRFRTLQSPAKYYEVLGLCLTDRGERWHNALPGRPRHPRIFLPPSEQRLWCREFVSNQSRGTLKWPTWGVCRVLTFSYYVMFIHMFIFKRKAYRGFCLP